MNRTFYHELAILIGGTFLGAVSSDLTKLFPSMGWSLGLMALSVIFILGGFAVPQRIFRVIVKRVRARRWRKPRVGILGGLDSIAGDGIEAVNTDISPTEWEEEIRKASVRRGVSVTVKMIPAKNSLDSFDAVINPFGATYPEESFRGFPVYARLLEYIREGGLLVNVADIPTYFAFNVNLRRSIDRTPAVYYSGGQPTRYFSRIPLMEELAVQVKNCEKVFPSPVSITLKPKFLSCGSPPASLLVTRAAIVEGNVSSVVAPLALGEYLQRHYSSALTAMDRFFVRLVGYPASIHPTSRSFRFSRS